MTMTQAEWDELTVKVDEQMKAAQGHSFVTILKTRCQYCGRSPRAKGKCGGWFMTYMNILAHELRDRGIIT